MTDDKITNMQRQDLVKIVSEIMERKIQKAKKDRDRIKKAKKEEVRKELGSDKIDQQIKELDKKIRNLSKKKEELGLGTYGTFFDGSSAQKLLNEKLSDVTHKVRSLQLEKAKSVSLLWTTTSLSEAKELVESVLNQE